LDILPAVKSAMIETVKSIPKPQTIYATSNHRPVIFDLQGRDVKLSIFINNTQKLEGTEINFGNIKIGEFRDRVIAFLNPY
jgi:hypothetical protein